jgi:phage RecT family recombinase
MMNPQTDNPVRRFQHLVAQAVPEVVAGFPRSIPESDLKRAADMLVFSLRSAAARNPKIYECSPQSVAQCVANCAALNLMPGGANPVVDLIPRRNSFKTPQGRWEKRMELNFQVGWRGHVVLANRVGILLDPVPVFGGDEYMVSRGFHPDIVHRPNPSAARTWDNLIAVYVVIRYPDGRTTFAELNKGQIEERRNNSDSWKRNDKGRKGPWEDWPVEMAMKTTIKYAHNRGLLPEAAEDFTFAINQEYSGNPVVIDAFSSNVTPMPPRAIEDKGPDDTVETVLAGFGERMTAREPAAEPTTAPAAGERMVDAVPTSPAPPVPPAEAYDDAPGNPTSARAAPAGGGGLSGGSSSSLAAVRAAEQRLPEDSVAAIRRELSIRKNARLEGLDESQLSPYQALLDEEHESIHRGG